MRKTVWDHRLDNFERHPDRDAVVHWAAGEAPSRWTWGELLPAASSLSVRPGELGVREGDVCALIVRHNGFVPLDSAYRDAGPEIKPPVANGRREIDCFVGFVDRLRANGIGVLFVELPEYNRGVRCESVRENEMLLREIAGSRGLTFIDYNQERRTALNDDPGFFGDWRHLNYAGARRFSKLLSEDVNALIAKGTMSPD